MPSAYAIDLMNKRNVFVALTIVIAVFAFGGTSLLIESADARFARQYWTDCYVENGVEDIVSRTNDRQKVAIKACQDKAADSFHARRGFARTLRVILIIAGVGTGFLALRFNSQYVGMMRWAATQKYQSQNPLPSKDQTLNQQDEHFQQK